MTGNNGPSYGPPYGSGGIDNTGTLVVTNSIISNNSAGGGPDTDDFAGGILNQPGAVMTLTDVTLSGNSGSEWGGIGNQGTATLNGVTLSDNEASGIFIVDGNFGPGATGGIGNDGKMT